MSFVLPFNESWLMCTSRAGRREACFAAFIFLCLLKYTLLIIADLKNLQILNPGLDEEEAWLEEQEEEADEEEELNDWSSCFVVEHLLEWEERGSALASRNLAFFRL